MDRVEVASVIRFHLHQLGAKNAAHDFEELCRQLAILRIASNVLRATGPVGAGGDQGRDFETFRTYIAATDIGSSTLVGRASGKNLAFACTLQQEGLKAKVKSDLAKIMGGSEPVETVYIFTEADIPVSDRHDLQAHARSSHQIGVEIFDGLNIADLLASPDTFWIADRFLGLPAAVYLDDLQQSDETWYEQLRAEWRERTEIAGTFGEYSDLRRGVRHATTDEASHGDLPFWIGKLNELMTKASPAIAHRATYELAVASLRGLGTLSGLEPQLVTYFGSALNERNASALEDAQVLLMYVSGAHQRNLVAIDDEQMRTIRDRLSEHLNSVAVEASNSSLKAALLHSLAAVRLIPTPPYNAGLPADQINLAFGTMQETLNCAREGHLFPIDRFADWIDAAAPLIVDAPGYSAFSDELDRLVIERTGRAAAAQHRRDRAMALYRKDRLVAALREMHQTRIDWFAGDTIRGSLLAMLMIAHVYERLNLPMASKYYGLAAANVAITLGDDKQFDIAPRGVLIAANADYMQGAFFNFLNLADEGLHLRYQIQGKHPAHIQETEQVVLALAVLTQFAKRHDQELYDNLEDRLQKLDILDVLGEILDGADGDAPYPTPESFAQQFAEQLGAVPFADSGAERWVSWSALGISWHVRFANDYDTTRAGERFCALAQILLADMANVELALLPTEITIHLRTTDDKSSADALPSNDGRAWEVAVPRQLSSDDLDRGISETVGVVVQVLVEVSLLPLQDAKQRMEDAFKAGLPGKLTPNTTYDHAFGSFVPPDRFYASERVVRAPIALDSPVQPHQDQELAWRTSPGPTYSGESAEEFIRTRYRRAGEVVRFALPRLLATRDGEALVANLRRDGWIDWRILSAFSTIALNWRVNLAGPKTMTEWRQLALKYQAPEPVDEPAVPLLEFSMDNVRMADDSNMLSTIRVWSLDLRQRTPDFPAVRRFLNVRYRHDQDDSPHEDPFTITPAKLIVETEPERSDG